MMNDFLSRLCSLLAGLVLAAILALGLSACGKEQPFTFTRPPAPVQVATAIRRNVPQYLDEVGTCQAREMVVIQPQVSGRITALHFTDGQDLKAGQLLFTIDPAPFQAQLDAARAALAQAQAARDIADINFTRARRLIASKAIAQQEYDTARNAVAVAKAQIESAQAAVETARLNLGYCDIRCPIDGRAGQRLVDPGNIVTANTTSLLSVQRLDPIYADLTVSENDLTAVQQAMAAGPLDVHVRLPDEPDRPIDGRLTFLDNAVANGTGTIRLRATVPNADHRLWPGRFIKVRLILRRLPQAVLVPAAAIQVSAEGNFVFVVDQQSQAQFRLVKVGQRQGDMVVISEGLKPGERVITHGQMTVTPGAKVQIIAPGNAPTTAPATQAGGSR